MRNLLSRMIIGVALTMLMLSVSLSAAVPNLIDYQGLLTDAADDPVPDGMYAVELKIWNDAVSLAVGDLMWNSGVVMVTTVNGAFSVTLGEGPQPPLPAGLFDDATLWLGIKVGADPEMSPRTELHSVPYALSAGNVIDDHGALSGLADDDHSAYVNVNGDVILGDIEHQNSISEWTAGGIPAFEVDPNNGEFSLYGTSGAILANLSNQAGFGDFKLYREGLVDERVWIRTTAGTGSMMDLWGTVEDPPYTNGIRMIGGDGSRLFLFDQIGNLGAGFDMLSSINGNSRVNLPDSAIDASEILDEPGLSHEVTFGPYQASSGTDINVDSVSITVPGNGYVLVMVNGYSQTHHITGNATTGRLWVSQSGSLDFDNFFFGSYPAVLPSGEYYQSVVLSMVAPVTAGNSYKFRVRADRSGGAAGAYASYSRMHTTAIFFPTNYGTIEATKSPSSSIVDDPNDPSGMNAPRSQVQVITVAEHESKLKAAKEELMRQMEDRMTVLEDRLNSLNQK